MSITRLKQARQMRKGGGVMGSNAGSMLVAPTADGTRPGYFGPDDGHAGEMGSKGFGSDYSGGSLSGGGEGISDEGAKRALADNRNTLATNLSAAKAQKEQQAKAAQAKQAAIQKDLAARRGVTPAAYSYGKKINPYDFSKGPRGPIGFMDAGIMTAKSLYNKYQNNRIRNLMMKGDIEIDPVTGKYVQSVDVNGNIINPGAGGMEKQIQTIPIDEPYSGFFKSRVFPNDGDGIELYVPPINYNTGALKAEVEEVEPYDQFSYNEEAFGRGGESADVRRASYDFNEGGRAGGGIMGTRARRAFGGIMDRVTGRKAYGLGSIFKSVGKAVKGVAKAAGKVLKSDVGKMALMAAGAYYAPAMFGGTTGFGAGSTYGNFARGIMSPNLIGPMTKAGSLGRTLGNFAINNKALTAGIVGLGGLSLFGREAKPNEDIGMRERGGPLLNSQGDGSQGSISREIQEAYASGDSERIAQLQKYYNYMLPSQDAVQDLNLPSSLPYPNYAEGGRIGFNTGKIVPPVEMPDPMERMLKNMTPEEKAKFQMMLKINAARMPEYKPDPNAIPPVEMPTYPRTNRAEGGLLDMGGMEKDYRNDGGFVPIGEYEKKDDVPARLSVNEFVFTADAVRGAGGGDIDKGAEIMENVMKNLEDGGQMSKESQGNTGAQEMFSVSQRLGEVL